jgi:pimeloyl-ACP methyl ester carboxylesterase
MSSIAGVKEIYLLERMADDIVAAMHSLGIAGAVGVGHSMSGHSVPLPQSQDSELFAALLLVASTVTKRMGMPRDEDEGGQKHRGSVPWEFVMHRRSEWNSVMRCSSGSAVVSRLCCGDAAITACCPT